MTMNTYSSVYHYSLQMLDTILMKYRIWNTKIANGYLNLRMSKTWSWRMWTVKVSFWYERIRFWFQLGLANGVSPLCIKLLSLVLAAVDLLFFFKGFHIDHREHKRLNKEANFLFYLSTYESYWTDDTFYLRIRHDQIRIYLSYGLHSAFY